MKEIIPVHVGNAGIQLSERMWQMFGLEHDINLQGERGTKTDSFDDADRSDFFKNYYSEDKEKRFRPRAVHLDLESAAIDKLKKGPCKDLFHGQSFAIGKGGSGNLFARGRSMFQTQNIEISMDKIRKQAEKCENLSGFLLLNSLGGGTGSGCSSVLLEKLTDAYNGKVKMGFNIYPGKRTPFSCVEPYNTVLALHSISQYQDISIVLDNLAIEDIGRQIFDLECTPSFTLMNEIISHAITGITGPTRLEGDSDFSLNTLKSSMVDEHFRFLVTAASPLVSNQKSCALQDVNLLTQLAFQPSRLMAKCDLRHGKFLASKLMYRGYMRPKYISEALQDLTKSSRRIMAQMRCTISTHFNPAYSKLLPKSQIRKEMMNCYMLSNNTEIGTFLGRFQYQFNKMHSFRAFMHWYVGQGMEEKQFEEASENLKTLIANYQEAGMQADDSPDQ